MIPARFEYYAPETLDAAISLLDECGPDAVVLAGGQSLIPLMKLQLAMPECVVDINRIPGLADISEDDDGLRIGSLTRESDLDSSEVVPAGERVIPVADLFEGPLTTTLEHGEILTEIRIPAPPPGTGGAYVKLERKVGDYAIAAAAAVVTVEDGVCRQAGIGLTNAGPTPVQAGTAESFLAGKRLDDETIGEAARLASLEAQPSADLRGSEDYKRDMARVIAGRALRLALERAG